MKLELRRVSLATPHARNARRSWPTRDSLLLRLTDARGVSGLGEATPLPGYSPDQLPQVQAALERVTLAAIQTALEQATARAALRAVASLLPEALPSARMALETAALDLLGRRHHLPAPVLLGGQAAAQRPLAQLLGPASEPALQESAERAVRAGFSHLKLKLGAEGRLAEELRGIAQLRQRLGSRVSLRLDANGSLSAAAVTRAWQALESSSIELFEEPGVVPSALLGEIPLALDESLQGQSEADVEALLRRVPVRCLVLKPMALGGLDHCWRLAERARDAGVDVVVSHCFDGPLAWRAAAALALALPRGRAHGLAPHAALEPWQSAALPVQHGVLEAWKEPGLADPGRFDAA